MKRTQILVAVLLLVLALPSVVPAQGGKAAQTPSFWQRDPEAGFEDEGRQHCAPTSVSNALMYLALGSGMSDLVDGFDKKSQIALIETLAEDMKTDPAVGGTNPDRVMRGLQDYVVSRGYDFHRLEIATWRSLSPRNRRFQVGARPNLDWLRTSAADGSCGVVINTGWYSEEDGGYVRSSGHWVTVVGVGHRESTLLVHNPILQSSAQRKDQAVTLTEIDEAFTVLKSSGEATDMKGYYEIGGPGLPYPSKASTAIVDCAIVFSLKH